LSTSFWSVFSGFLSIWKFRFGRAFSAGGRGGGNAVWGDFVQFCAKIVQKRHQMTQNDKKTWKHMTKHVFEQPASCAPLLLHPLYCSKAETFQMAQKPSKTTPNASKTSVSMFGSAFDSCGALLDGFWPLWNFSLLRGFGRFWAIFDHFLTILNKNLCVGVNARWAKIKKKKKWKTCENMFLKDLE